MLFRVARGMRRRFALSTPPSTPQLGDIVSQSEFVQKLASIPHWQDKIATYNGYAYESQIGSWVRTNSTTLVDAGATITSARKINYGCGGNLIDGWLNIDLHAIDASNCMSVNLLKKHPFADETVEFGFSEDVLEHLTQAQSIFLLAEICRSLRRGGVMRFSFPGLEGVLERHYAPPSEARVREGEFEAYVFWDYIHFYSREELKLVASHLGFSAIEFVDYGVSKHPELCGLDTRETQKGLNTYVELTR